jgi:putative sigma-54 modulation protein
MLLPQITFRNLDSSPALRSRIVERVSRLERVFQRIVSCRVVLGSEHRRHHKGRLVNVRIDVKVPGHEIAVTRDPPERQPNEDIHVAVQEAFDAVERRLEELMQRRRGEVKAHAIA